ncbi:cysteine peptidase family C39 domain-containing protein [Ureaplasma urealyticum]|uniref:cysteine peptidase family C39 domain-containing protein n=1 Tax=Ureaplasma urealyticum TaxID=2130 RepID=UPI001F5FFBE0|nr:cysteine peptidase family C39 domain-containing protein [Ureaplasma urealyticum]UNT66123.1 ATP-binding cassette domain-containing protein [Ureaplasma urealyticum]
MKIVQQTSDNECGVCVINMLANYYHNKTIDKNLVLQKANLTKNGLNLQDLENLANEFSLDAQSFQCSFQELIDEKINDYFIALINRNGLNHFVIVKYFNKGFFRIYDPANQIYELNNEQFEHLFLNVIIRVCKNHKILNFPIFKEPYLKYIKASSLIIILLLELLNIPLSIFLSKTVNLLIDLVLINEQVKNLTYLFIIFSLFYISSAFKDLLITVYVNKISNRIFCSINNELITNLTNKLIQFFNKTNLGELSSIQIHLNNVIHFLLVSRIKLLVNVLFGICIICLLGLQNWILLLVSLTFGLLSLLIGLMNWKYFKNQSLKMINIENSLFIKYQNLIKLINFEHNTDKYNNYIHSYKEQLDESIIFRNKITIFKSNINFYLSIINNIGLLVLLVCLIINANYQYKIVSIITYIVFLHQNINNLSFGIFNFFNELLNFKNSKQIIEKILYVNNCEKHDGIEINKVLACKIIKDQKTFEFQKSCLIIGKSGIGKTTLLKNFLDFNNKNLFFNDLNISSLNLKQLKELIIYHPTNALINDFNINWFVNQNQEITNALKIVIATAKIDWSLNSNFEQNINLSTGQQQILAFLNLLKYKNKLLLLDEPLAHVDTDNKKIILDSILPLVLRNNFVIYVSHDHYLKNYFDQIINLNDEKMN